MLLKGLILIVPSIIRFPLVHFAIGRLEVLPIREDGTGRM